MPLLDIEKQLFVVRKNDEKTIQITVKNAGTGPLELQDVFPIGECKSHIDINFSRNLIEEQASAIIDVTINNYWKPVEIQFDTNCPRTGKIIYVLRWENFRGPNLWLFPDKKYNSDQVFFHDPEPYLQLPMIVQSNSDNPLELDFYLKLNGNSVTSHEIDVYCGETDRKVSRQGKERHYQILNIQKENYQVHFANIHFPMIENGPVGQAIQLKICTNSRLTELRKQEISIQLTKLEVTPEENLCLRLRKENPIELKLKNSGPHPLRIFGIPTDLDKIEVEYLETDNEKTEVSYPIVIQKDKSKNLGITIKSSFKERLWSSIDLSKGRLRSGIDLSNVSIPIYANTVSDPQSYKVSPCEMKMQSTRSFLIVLIALIVFIFALICLVVFFMFFREPEPAVIVSSYPHGQTVRVDRKEAGTTPTLLKVKGNARIQIGSSDERQVKDVQKEGTIFFPGSEWKTGKGESK